METILKQWPGIAGHPQRRFVAIVIEKKLDRLVFPVPVGGLQAIGESLENIGLVSHTAGVPVSGPKRVQPIAKTPERGDGGLTRVEQQLDRGILIRLTPQSLWKYLDPGGSAFWTDFSHATCNVFEPVDMQAR